MSNDLDSLFAGSGLDDDAVAGLTMTADDLGPAINAGLGDVTADTLGDTEATLVTLVIDDTASIEYAGLTQQVIDGHNLVLDSLAGAKTAGGILISCRFITGNRIFYPFVPLAQAIRMDSRNYRADGGSTPLFDAMAVTLSTVTAKMAELEDGGVAVRGVTYGVSDGFDNASRVHRGTSTGSSSGWGGILHAPKSLSDIVKGLLTTESHIIGAMGIGDGQPQTEQDFRAVFGSMGIRDKWILTPSNDPADVRRGFGTISQSAVRASQAVGGAFSKTTLGGFDD
jgi:hypothetical protein